MIKFKGLLVPGTHGPVRVIPPAIMVKRTYFWGLHGESEITSRPAGRELTCQMWIHYQWPKRKNIDDFMKALDDKVGEHGTLEESVQSQGFIRSFKDCTYLGFFREGIGGRENVDPIFDYAGTVDGGWFAQGTLKFYQLQPSS